MGLARREAGAGGHCASPAGHRRLGVVGEGCDLDRPPFVGIDHVRTRRRQRDHNLAPVDRGFVRRPKNVRLDEDPTQARVKSGTDAHVAETYTRSETQDDPSAGINPMKVSGELADRC
jgi:hypothetical protein